MSFATSSRTAFRDLLKFAIFTAALWSLSLTILLPIVVILNRCSRIRGKVFAVLWRFFGQSEKRLRHLRRVFFEALRNDLPDFDYEEMNVMEVGIGHVGNLPFYSKNHRITFVCKNKELCTYMQSAMKKCKSIDFDGTLFYDFEQLQNVPDGSVDVVISNLCLCSVFDLDAFLKELKRVLKKGGKFAFLEHVGFPEDRFEFTLQMMATKFWKIFSDGCCLDRHITDNLKKARFATISYTTYYPQSQYLCMRPTVIGFCTK